MKTVGELAQAAEAALALVKSQPDVQEAVDRATSPRTTARVADRFGSFRAIVGVPVEVTSVRVGALGSGAMVKGKVFVGLSNTRLPIIRFESSVTVNGPVRPAVLKLAVLPMPSATIPPAQLAVVLQL